MGWSALFLFVVDDESDDGADDNKEGDATDDEGGVIRTTAALVKTERSAVVATIYGFFPILNTCCGFRDFRDFWRFGAVDFYFGASDVKFVAVAVDVHVVGIGVV